MKVYSITSHWHNGRRFEGDILTKVTADYDEAKAILANFKEEAVSCIEEAYGCYNVDYDDERTACINISEDEYDDYWDGVIKEHEI